MKTVLITGGVRGIGKSIADAFAKKGYRVCVTYLSTLHSVKGYLYLNSSSLHTVYVKG